MSDKEEEYDCQGKHLQVGNSSRCMKCGVHIIDFGDYNEGDGVNGWKLMKGTFGKKHEL